jgi:tetratricopeptide (TPR) repeat protein
MGARGWWCAALAALLLTGCEEPYDAGVVAFDAGQWDEAVDRLERVSPFHLNYKDAQELIRQSLYKAGEEAFDTGRWSQAIGYFRQTAESDPNYASAQDRIGISFYEMAREALGKGDATEALRLSNIVQTTCSQFSAARDIARAARGRLPDRQEIASRN